MVLLCRTYGSGYPGFANQRGVAGLGFPFYFWPLVWGGAAFSGARYLNDNEVRSLLFFEIVSIITCLPVSTATRITALDRAVRL